MDNPTDVIATAVALIIIFVATVGVTVVDLCMIGLPIRFLILLIKRHDRKVIKDLKVQLSNKDD